MMKPERRRTQCEASFLPCLRALGFIAYHSVQDMKHSEGSGVVAADRIVVVRDAGANDKCRAGKSNQSPAAEDWSWVFLR